MNLVDTVQQVTTQWLDSGSPEPLMLQRDVVNDRVLVSLGWGAGAVSAKEAARLLGVSGPTFRDRCAAGVYRLSKNDAGEFSLADVYRERNRFQR